MSFIAVNALVDHPDVKAVTFAGTSHIAEIIAQRCHKLNKRVLALGGSKVHNSRGDLWIIPIHPLVAYRFYPLFAEPYHLRAGL